MFTKLVVLIVILAAVWTGFKYIARLNRIDRGERRPSERTLRERIRKAARSRDKSGSDSTLVEDTEECLVCHAFVSVDAQERCKKPACPY